MVARGGYDTYSLALVGPQGAIRRTCAGRSSPSPTAVCCGRWCSRRCARSTADAVGASADGDDRAVGSDLVVTTTADRRHPLVHRSTSRMRQTRYSSFLGGDGITLEGRRVADIGCGDGIIDLGLALKGHARGAGGLRPHGCRHGCAAARRPRRRTWRTSCRDGSALRALRADRRSRRPTRISTSIVTWSVFEHVDDPVAMLGEVRRVIKPDGYLFLQLWPFYDSEHGGHLWPHYEGPFPHLLRQRRADPAARSTGARAPTRVAPPTTSTARSTDHARRAAPRAAREPLRRRRSSS